MLSLSPNSLINNCVTAFCFIMSLENMSLKTIGLLSFVEWADAVSAEHVIRAGRESGWRPQRGQDRLGLYNSEKSVLMPDTVFERSRNRVDISFLEKIGLHRYGCNSNLLYLISLTSLLLMKRL